MLAILALTVLPVAEVRLPPADMQRAAAGIRITGHPCDRVTSVTRVRDGLYRVACGTNVYRVRYGNGAASVGRW